MKQWYVVHTKPNGENLALANLDRQGYRAYMPQYLKRRRHARRVDWVRSPLFPRYLFVALDVTRDMWRAVNSTFGVNHIVCHGEKPTPMPSGVVEDLLSREDENGMVPLNAKRDWRKGERVRVLDGPLSEYQGFFERFSDEERVILLMDMLGRQVPVRVPLGVVGAVA